MILIVWIRKGCSYENKAPDSDNTDNCGICENKYPVKGKPAIKVMAVGETRSKKNQILLGLKKRQDRKIIGPARSKMLNDREMVELEMLAC